MRTIFILMLSACACFAEPTTQAAKIMVPIVEQTTEGEFRDCLYFTQEQWVKLTDADIVAQKHQRKTNWLAFIEQAKQPQPVIEPTPEDIEVQIKQAQDAIKQQQAALDAVQIKLEEVFIFEDLRGGMEELKK